MLIRALLYLQLHDLLETLATNSVGIFCVEDGGRYRQTEMAVRPIVAGALSGERVPDTRQVSAYSERSWNSARLN
jgi:hypothetical protein